MFLYNQFNKYEDVIGHKPYNIAKNCLRTSKKRKSVEREKLPSFECNKIIEDTTDGDLQFLESFESCNNNNSNNVQLSQQLLETVSWTDILKRIEQEKVTLNDAFTTEIPSLSSKEFSFATLAFTILSLKRDYVTLNEISRASSPQQEKDACLKMIMKSLTILSGATIIIDNVSSECHALTENCTSTKNHFENHFDDVSMVVDVYNNNTIFFGITNKGFQKFMFDNDCDNNYDDKNFINHISLCKFVKSLYGIAIFGKKKFKKCKTHKINTCMIYHKIDTVLPELTTPVPIRAIARN